MWVGPRQILLTDLDPLRLVDSVEDDTALGRVDLGDAPALAVEDFGARVVDAGDDEIAGGEAGLADLDLLPSELPGLAAN